MHGILDLYHECYYVSIEISLYINKLHGKILKLFTQTKIKWLSLSTFMLTLNVKFIESKLIQISHLDIIFLFCFLPDLKLHGWILMMRARTVETLKNWIIFTLQLHIYYLLFQRTLNNSLMSLSYLSHAVFNIESFIYSKSVECITAYIWIKKYIWIQRCILS